MIFVEYIQASLEKTTIGSKISLGIFALIGFFAIWGLLFGLKRGFSKTVIRAVTIVASAVGAYFATSRLCNMLSTYLTGQDVATVDALLESISPDLLQQLPEGVRPFLAELGMETATIIVMMAICLLIAPIIFIAAFFILKGITYIIYAIISLIAGMISYRKGFSSTISGGLFGILVGAFIGCVVILPFGGLLSIVEEARTSLLDNDDPDPFVETLYTEYLDDVLDNPVLSTIRGWGGEYVYNNMVTVQIGDHKVDMADEAKELFRLALDLKPLYETDFEWTDPKPEHREALTTLLEDIDHNDLVASLISDLLRGAAMAIDGGAIDLPVDGPVGMLAHDTLAIFKTSSRDNIGEDLDIILDVYFIMCDDGILVALNHGDEDIITDLFSEIKPDGKTAIVHITDRLNESERSRVIISTLTKISVSLIQGSLGLDEEQTELYENVKDDFRDVLNHNKSDYASEEEYREAISTEFDKALEENNITLSEDAKNSMLDYISDNYGESEEITDDDINNALLSYFASQGGNMSNLPDNIPDGILGGDSEEETPEVNPDEIPEDMLDQIPDGYLGSES